MSTTQSSQLDPATMVVAGTTVAPVDWLIVYCPQGVGVLVGVAVDVRVRVTVGGVPVIVGVGVPCTGPVFDLPACICTWSADCTGGADTTPPGADAGDAANTPPMEAPIPTTNSSANMTGMAHTGWRRNARARAFIFLHLSLDEPSR